MSDNSGLLFCGLPAWVEVSKPWFTSHRNDGGACHQGVEDGRIGFVVSWALETGLALF